MRSVSKWRQSSNEEEKSGFNQFNDEALEPVDPSLNRGGNQSTLVFYTPVEMLVLVRVKALM